MEVEGLWLGGDHFGRLLVTSLYWHPVVLWVLPLVSGFCVVERNLQP